jgi:hypothetical protein
MTAWALAFLALQLGDVLTTSLGLARPGVYEANPLVAWLFATLGMWAILPLKGLGAAVILWAARRRKRRSGASKQRCSGPATGTSNYVWWRHSVGTKMGDTAEATRVVNVRYTFCDVYIGRAMPHYGLARSKWANPYKEGCHGTRREVIERYRAYLLDSPDLLAALPELRGKVLGCWCRPIEGFRGRLLCHGQILAGLADDVSPESIT